MNERPITCGCCGHTGMMGDGFEWEMVDLAPWAVIRCNSCGAELMFDVGCYIDFDVVADCESDWTEGE